MSDFQRVYVDGPYDFDQDGNLTVTVKYQSNDSTTTGLGLNVHYDSSSMTLTDVSDALGTDAFIALSADSSSADSYNADGEAQTDVYHTSAWSSLFGSWPGSTGADLYTLTFTKVEGGNENYQIHFSSESNAAGFELILEPHVPPVPLSVVEQSIDENSGEGQVIATVEGGPANATYSLVDNTIYGGEGSGPAETQINIPDVQADTQHVYVSESTLSDDGSQATITVAYNAADTTLTGLGLHVHYDSSVLTLAGTSDVLSTDLFIQPNNNAEGDVADDNEATDSYVMMSWSSLFGAWPGTGPVNLATLTFDVAAGAGGATPIDFTVSSNAAGQTFAGQEHTIQLPEVGPLSIDSATGDVTLNVNPDYESVPVYNFDVVANAGEASVSASVSIGNVDEAAPVFAEAYVEADAIAENSGAGQVVYTAQADDSADTSAGVSYSLAGADAAAFSVDGSGAVTLTDNPDYEAKSSYSFTVVADDGVNATASQDVTLAITNVDDTAPVISSSADAGSIEENSGAGQVVYTAEASDETSGVTYSLAGADAGAFSIDSNGAVTLTANPDYETQNSYSFDVVATDDAGNASQQTVSLAVNDISETNPVFDNTPDPVVDENSEFSYTASATIESGADLTYSLTNDFGGVFSIDATSGVVSMSESPDHEAGINYSFTIVAADDAGNSSEKIVSLTVNDLDDSAPTFTESSVVATSITENTGAGQTVYTATADDSGDISDGVSYSFYSNTATTDSPDLQSNTQHLYVSQTVLSEDNSTLTATVTYNSLVAGTAGLGLRVHYDSSSLTLNSLADALDTDLIFTNILPTADTDDFDSNTNTDTFIDAGWASLYGNWPSEGLPTDLFTLKFDIDPSASNSTDLGISALASPIGIAFEGETQSVLLSPNIGHSLGALTIDASSGEVTLVDNPDYETTAEYNFSVLATDAAGNQSDPQSISVAINDEVLAITSSETATPVDENIGENQVVYSTTVSGAEAGDQITFSLLSAVEQQQGGIEQRFLNNQDGSITLQLFVSPSIVNNYPDSIENFDLVLNYNASEITSPSLSLTSETELSVIEETVTGEIKIAGIFLNQLPNIQDNPIVELDFEFNPDIASTQFTVSDVLLGLDNTVLDQSVSRYYDSRGFDIDANTGAVSLVGNPDHETQIDYIFTVMASDVARGLSDTQTVRLSVNDLDDAIPTITSDDNVVAIDENSGAGQIIYTATAIDSGDISDGLTFSLADGSDDALVIDATSGEVSLTVDPDHEVQSQYSFEVVAIDAAGNASQGLSLTLDINDIDDTAPIITSGDTIFSIDENSSAGQVIYTATADDSLDVTDGSVTFSLAEGSDDALSVNELTGEVTLTANPDYELQNQYSFAVIATDAQNNESVAESVTLEINNLDDTASIITSADTADAIDENSGAGQVIYTATADDSSDLSHGLTFSLTDGSDSALTIDSLSGEVTLATNPDHETQAQYSFAVVATDAANNQSAAQSVTLDINDLDDTKPVIVSGETAVAIDENSGAGQVVYTAQADDSADVSEGVTFSLAEGSDAAVSIDENTGAVTLSADPDYEAQTQYSFVVVATDAAGNVSESQSVTLDINNLDDFSLAGKVYHWGTQALMDDVSVSMRHSDTDQHIETVSTNTAGDYVINELAADEVVVTLERDLQEEDEGRFITSLDALSALKMAVGINPNPKDDSGIEQINISAYQFIAADVNKSGKVTSADALEILRMAVRVPTAIEREWLFIDESEDFWDETANDGQGALSVNRTSVLWNSDGVEMTVSQADQKNFVGVMLGDVYSSWNAPAASQYIEYDHLVNLENSGTAPLYQWGMSPQDVPFAINSSVAAENILENSGFSQPVYTVTSNEAGVTYSLGGSLDSSLFSINSNTGEVTLLENPNYEAQSQYSFEVFATNSEAVTVSQTVSLSVSNDDEIAPAITSGEVANSIDENTGAGQVIYTAAADDSGDDIVVGPISFSLAEGSDSALSIDASSGEVTLSTDPDHEIQSQYSFAVIATDGAGNASAAQSVSLAINNLDEIAPTITSTDTADTIDENSGAGQVIYTVTADDSADISAGVSFSLVDNSGAVSEINVPDLLSNTQHVYVSESTKSVDGTQETVVISYNADTEATTGLGLQIHFNSSVLGVDSLANVLAQDNIFAYSDLISDTEDYDNDASTDAYLSIGWASLFGTWPGSVPIEIATVTFDLLDTAIDASAINLVSSSNAAGYDFDGQSHSLAINTGASVLSIDSNTGEVTLIENPDFEARSEYNFDIVATDAAGNSSIAQAVTLSINEIVQMPMITSEDIGIVLEGSGADQAVYTATSNIDGATYSLVDNTVYPTVGDNSQTFETVVTIPELAVATQHVYVSESTKSEDGTQAIVKVSYNADDSTTTGLGLRIHYDSSAFTLSDISDVLSSDLFIPPTTSPTADANDYDNDASTDSYVLASWTSLFGSWPNSVPTDLMTLTFDIADDATGMSAINFTTSSNAAGFDFDGQQHNVAVVESTGGSSDSSGATGSTESVVTVPQLQADTQHVYVSESTKSEDGTQAIVKVSYNIDDATTTGLGLRIHFDSSALSAPALSNILTNDLFINGQIVNDDEDFDGDASTDQYINFSWASLFGQWPGSAPVDLATITFDIVEGASGSSTINLTSSSNAAGFGFDGQSHDVVISAESEPSEPESMPSQLSIDAATGVVTLEGEADYQTVPNYMFTVTAANGDETASQDVGLLVADYLVSADSNTYTGTDEADVFALADGSAQVTSGDGADIFILAPPSEEGAQPIDMHTLVDFETGVDSIDASVALMALGYTGLSTALDGGAQQNKLSALTDVSADILDLVSNNDTSLNNAFGSYFDDASNELTIFVDTDASLESQMIETFEIEVGEGNTVEDDDLTVSFNTFIA